MQTELKKQKGVDRKDMNDLPPLILKAVTLAMGIAVTVLSILKAIDIDTGFFMLGLGLTCAGIFLISDKNKNG